MFEQTAADARSGEVPVTWADAIACAVVVCCAALILFYYHDRFWWPPVDGAYAHVAERILAGEVLHRDVQDIHAGHVNLVNAGAMGLFGMKMVALRYPLVVLTLIQTCLVFFLLLPRGRIVAMSGAAAMTALTFVQFPNPTANWYALFFLVAVLSVLAWVPRESCWRLGAVGFLLITLFLFRQLSGVLVGIGVMTYLLSEASLSTSPGRRPKDKLLARALLSMMGLGLVSYLLLKTSLGALVLFGIGPLGILIWVSIHTDQSNRDVAKMLLPLCLGGLAALAPLFLYHLANGSMSAWINDTVLVAFALTELPFFEDRRFSLFLLFSAASFLQPSGPVGLVNSLYVILLILLAPILAYMTLRGLSRDGMASGTAPYLLPMLASFHALVAVHYQAIVYLTYTVAITLAGLLWLAAARSARARWGTIALAVFLSATGLYFHAGQSIDRGWIGIVAGSRNPVYAAPDLERVGLRIGAEDAAIYRDLVELIQRETPKDGAILVLPLGPELYFLSDRRNPTRFHNISFGIRSEAELKETISTLRNDPPDLVLYRPRDHYDTAYAARLMDYVHTRYERLPSQGGYDIYRTRAR